MHCSKIGPLFDHLGGGCEQLWGNGEIERFAIQTSSAAQL